MISVAQADRMISRNLPKYKSVSASLDQSARRILHEPLLADRNFPPCDNALMDGIAIQVTAYQKGQRVFQIEGVQAAGYPAKRLSSPNGCLEIMTGAMIPKGTNCVVPVELIDREGNQVIIRGTPKLKIGNAIRHRAEYHRKGAILVKPGIQLGPTELAIAASIGKSSLKVSPRISVALISSGDELVGIKVKKLKPYQIRQSSLVMMKWALDSTGLTETQSFHFPDDERVLKWEIKKILGRVDVLVFTGGVSKGKFDFVPAVLKDLGVKCLFHQVAQMPGRPFWFGKSKHGQPVFALPGNPVSTQVGIYRFVIPHLKTALGYQSSSSLKARLSEEFNPKTDVTFYLPVKLSVDPKGVLNATPMPVGGSGDFVSLTGSDGFVEIPAKTSRVRAGTILSLYHW